MPYLDPAALSALLKEKSIKGPDRLETLQSFEGGYVEDALDAMDAVTSQEVDDAADVATVITALKAMGIFVDPTGS